MGELSKLHGPLTRAIRGGVGTERVMELPEGLMTAFR